MLHFGLVHDTFHFLFSIISVPSNYNYLPDTSILKPLVGFLIQAGRHGSSQIPEDDITQAMTSLVEGSKERLPPINWAVIFTTLTRQYKGIKSYIREWYC